MSYILNASGEQINADGADTVSGGNHNFYYYRVKDLIRFLKNRWGAPDLVIPYPPSGSLDGKTGIILFEVSGWSDAGGHATVWNGRSCYDHCYFYTPDLLYHTTRANFWEVQ
jgi:hypothetical protein